MRLRTQRRGVAPASAAAGFAAGVACALLLLVGHQHHSEVHAHGRDSLPGELPSVVQTTAAASAASAEGSSRLPSGALPPPPVLQAASAEQQLQQEATVGGQLAPLPDFDALPHLMISFGNAAYFPLAHNWAKSVHAIGAPYVMAAFDDKLMELCAQEGLACQRVELPGLGDADFRGDFKAFRLMGAIKIRYVSDMLERHPSLPLVMVSDTDAVWLREPWAYFEQRPTAEFFISTDCLSMRVEDEWKPRHDAPRCGHVPGNDGGRAFNTGMFAARNTPASRAFLRAWADMLTDPNRERHTDPAHRGIDDQMALNLLFNEGDIVGVGPDDPRIILAFNRTLRVQPMPVALFSNGHVSFTQSTPWKRGIAPIVIHNTFLRFGVPSKVLRFREFGLWLMDTPEYYGAVPQDRSGGSAMQSSGSSSSGSVGADGGGGDGAVGSWEGSGGGLNFLTWDADVQQFVREQEAARYGGKAHGMPLMEKHWVAMSYQLQALRDGLAAARMLGRVAVLPKLWCWCDFDEHPLILESCRIRGTDLELPFQCPLDFLLPVGLLDSAPLPYRPAGFLDLPQLPFTVRHSRSAVQIEPAQPEAPFPVPAHTVGHGVAGWPGISEGELLRVVEPVAASRVLVLRGQVPGFLKGFDDPAESARFDAEFQAAVLDWGNTPFWCCFTWGDADQDHRVLHYQMPRPLADAWQPWQAPQLERPAWCDDVSTKHGNRDFMLLPQHPCTFLANETAAALAAAGLTR